ncbi:MAG: hypothetical protein IT370_12135 [Deltaproteobacteria bacterium]|nr:hypothetical protein [Deltaproteobacteria bacterium]
MTAARRLSPLGRWALVAAVVLMGAALAVTVWLTHSGVLGASDTLVRGQSDALQQTVRGALGQFGQAPDDAVLAGLLEELEDDGLRYLALLTPRYDVVAQAGKPAGDPSALPGLRNDTPQRVGGVVRVLVREPQRRGRSRRRPGDDRPSGPLLLLLEFSPQRAEALRASAQRTLLIGGLAAGTLLVIALVLVRVFMRRARQERELEQAQRLASLGQLSAVLAHEIRNPLASLKGNAQLLAQLLPAGEKPRAKADRVVDEAVRLEDLTNDLLAFARTGELHRREVDPAALLREVASAAAPEGGPAPAIELDLGAAPRTWSLDPERMRQVLGNLCDNAVKAGAPVRACVGLESGRLRFQIRDSGAGIAPDDLPHIFEPFFTKRIQGTGLGLAVAKRVVELHQGKITAANAPGGGAIFQVTLPPA